MWCWKEIAISCHTLSLINMKLSARAHTRVLTLPEVFSGNTIHSQSNSSPVWDGRISFYLAEWLN